MRNYIDPARVGRIIGATELIGRLNRLVASEMRIELTHGQFGVFEDDNNGRASLVATFGSLAAAREAFPQAIVQASAQAPLQSADRAAIGVAIGGVTVVALPILELIAAIAGLGSCSAAGSTDFVLIVITIALAAGGISTLVLASKSIPGSHMRTTARILGIVAIVMAAASVPINLFLVLLSGFCAIG